MLKAVLGLLGSKAGKLAGLIVLLIIILVVGRMIFPGVPYLVWILVAVGVLLIYVGWMIFEHLRAKRGSDAIAKELKEAAQSDADRVRPDRREAIRKIQSNLEHAVGLLEKHRPKGVSRGTALYSLPWVMVVGPPGDGKTFAVTSAGIKWPQAPIKDEGAVGGGDAERRVQGSGGTRQCNWFFSADAIILDMSGRFAERAAGEADRAEWLKFLELIRRARPKRPINGIIVGCSVERLVSGEESAAGWAAKVRAQLIELMTEMQVHTPVYILFTKCDLIHGFVEFFGDLSKKSREQIWGYTTRYDSGHMTGNGDLEQHRVEMLAEYDARFAELMDELDGRRIQRLADPESSPTERSNICIFPMQLQATGQAMRRFMEEVFEPNPFGPTPVLRGVYFSSATQREGNPMDRIMKSVAQQFDLPADALPLSGRKTVDPYFLHDLFHDVVFQDAGLAGRTKRSMFDRTRMWLAAGVVGLTALLSLSMIFAYTGNRQINQRLYDAAMTVDQQGRFANPEESLRQLDELRKHLVDYDRAGRWFKRPFRAILSLGKGNDMAQQAETKLLHRLKDQWIEPTRNSAAYPELITSSNFRNNPVSYIRAYKTYLAITDHATEDQLELLPPVLAQYMYDQWLAVRVFDMDKRREAIDQLNRLMTYYFLESGDEGRFIDDGFSKSTLEGARTTMQREWSWDLFLDAVGRDVVDTAAPFVAGSYEVVNGGSVPDVYSVEGWNRSMKRRVDLEFSELKQDPIMASIAFPGGDPTTNPLDSVYVDRCIGHWTRFFSGLEFVARTATTSDGSPTSARVGQFLADAADRVNFQQPRLQQHFGDLLQLAGLKSMIQQAAGAVGGGDGGPPPKTLRDYVAAIENLVSSFQSSETPSSGCGEYLRSLSSQINKERDSFLGAMKFGNSGFSKALQEFLKEPFSVGRNIAYSEACQCLDGAWSEQVYSLYNSSIRTFYPFSPNAGQDADVAVLDELLQAIEAFVEDEARKAPQIISRKRVQELLSWKRNCSRVLDVQEGAVSFPVVLKQDNVDPRVNLVRIIEGGRTYQWVNGPPKKIQLRGGQTTELVAEIQGWGTKSIAKASGPWGPLHLMDQAVLTFNLAQFAMDDVQVRLELPDDISGFRDDVIPRKFCR